ncbi:mannose-binding protein C [Penaeus vannamei]|uniref:mannose-binding protein C n=1 Tax=Penaeus vannamei TaxID=6689 RepID=UPI00387F495F
MDWDKARIFCQQMGGDLAVFKDANEFAAALDLVKSYNFDPETRVWIGVEDKKQEGVFVLITGEKMKKATPFWGRHPFVKYGTHHDCGSLYGRDDYLIHETICSSKHIPLCQIH